MNFSESIKKARERGMNDDQILEAIKKQNPHKADSFETEKAKGLSSTDILNNIIQEDTTTEKEQEKETPSSPKEESPPSIVANIPQKPSEETKLWMRIFIALILVSVTATSIAILYSAFFVPRLRPISPTTIIHEVYAPRAIQPLVRIYPERDSILRFPITADEEYLSYLRRISREEKSGEMVRIIVEDHREGVRDARITDLEDFFEIFEIDFPDNFFDKVERDFNLFVYTRETTGKFAFVVEFDRSVRDDVEWTIMRPWENTMMSDFRSFFAFWDIQTTEIREFSNTTHRGDMPTSFPIRYSEAGEGMGLYYTITDNRLLFGTSLDSIRVLIERYYYLGRQ